jgi:hypothetical protein
MVLLADPDAVLRALAQRSPAPRERLVARVLGLRHLAEGVVVARHCSPAWLLGGAAVDAVHCLSMAALAAESPRHRRLATASALTAAGTSVGGVLAAQSTYRGGA